ncbi:GGDEF domain-containing protein [Anatilimnocola floriformis]|uniref:GGDEF domain-containing protein n=1 Tax=Anatilimnocola floriformis TaxID=2948575 RepID=UPI0020C3EE3B|nr:GGDEF domain-containing protein [Anatilimnocola floriformis]
MQRLILFVLSIAIMNFGLGYALAVMLSDAPLLPADFLQRLKSAALGGEQAEPPPPTTANLEDIPNAWIEQLTAAHLPPGSFWEALLLKLWIEITPLREELLSEEVRARMAVSSLEATPSGQLLDDVKHALSRWQLLLDEVYLLLLPRLDSLGSDQADADRLDQQLEMQLGHLTQHLAVLADIDLEKERELGLRELLTVLRESIEQLHDHRDGVQALLGKRLRGSELIGSGQPLYLDPLTGQVSRMGLENLFELWFREDPQRLRLVSCALVDIDRFGRLNDRLGLRAGDRFLSTIANLVGAGIRTDRGFDRMARYSGEQFLLFFGDTGPRNAASAMERIRQSLEAVTLDYEGNEHDVTISAGIVSIQRGDTIEKLYARLEVALQRAKTDGRNRTAVDEGEGPETLFEPQRYPVRAKHVRIETQ